MLTFSSSFSLQNATFQPVKILLQFIRFLHSPPARIDNIVVAPFVESHFAAFTREALCMGFKSENFKDEKEKFTCFPMPHMKSPQAAQNTGSLKACSDQSKLFLEWNNTFATNLCPLTGWNFWAAWFLFILMAGSSPQEESKRTSSPFGFIGCRNSPSLSKLFMVTLPSLKDLSELKRCLREPVKNVLADFVR